MASIFEAGRAWVRGHVRLLGTVAAFLILYALAGFLLVPHLARSAIEDYVRDALRRQVSIAALSFNPFTLTAELRRRGARRGGRGAHRGL